MRRSPIVILFLLLLGCAGGITNYPTLTVSADTGTHVRLLRTLGGEAASPGIDEIAAMEAKLPGVTLVKVYEYYQTQQVADEVNAEPLTVKEVIEGGSCGANAAPVAAAGIRRRVDEVAVIQASVLCGGLSPLGLNVSAAQETYNPICPETLWLGCALLNLGPGFNPSNFTVIERDDCHPCAFVNPDAKNDMVDAVRKVTSLSAGARFGAVLGKKVPGSMNWIYRHHGQRMF